MPEELCQVSPKSHYGVLASHSDPSPYEEYSCRKTFHGLYLWRKVTIIKYAWNVRARGWQCDLPCAVVWTRFADKKCPGNISSLYVQEFVQAQTINDIILNIKNSHILPTGQRYAPSAVNYSAYSAHSAHSALSRDILHYLALSYTILHYLALSCTILHHLAPCCTMLHHVAPSCTSLHQLSPACTSLHHLAPSCTILHHLAPSCTIFHYLALSCSCTQLVHM